MTSLDAATDEIFSDIKSSFSNIKKSGLDQDDYYDKELLVGRDRELEAQSSPPSEVVSSKERTTSLKTKLLFLGVYFLLNLRLTISNKAVLGRVCGLL